MTATQSEQEPTLAQVIVPALMQGLTDGVAAAGAAGGPAGIAIATLAPLVVTLIKAGHMSAADLQTLITHVQAQVLENQKKIDALASKAGA